jgi:glycine cleavage system H protein
MFNKNKEKLMKNLKNVFAAVITLTMALVLFACSENSIQDKSIDKNVKGPDYVPMPYPGDRFYTEDHVWVKLESENVALVGITTFPLNSLGTVMATNDPIDETIKGKTGIPPKKIVQEIIGSLSNMNLLMPVAGDCIDVNPQLDVNPSIINTNTYSLGWILRITNFNISEVQNLMTAGQYTTYVGGL